MILFIKIPKIKISIETLEQTLDKEYIIWKVWKLSKNINDLTDELKELEKKRNSSFDTNEIKKFNAEIEKLNKNMSP